MLKRQAVNSIEAQKHQMIAALYANTNWDDEKNDRNQRIKELEEHFKRAIELVYDPSLAEGEEIDWDNPFWAAAKRAYDKKLARIRGESPNAQVADVVDAEVLEARRKAKASIDQA
jgi:hypothetical protein